MRIQVQRTNHEQINEMITKFEQDHHIHFRQVHRMIDLFETIIKTNTAILLANYFSVNKISDEVAKKLVQGMNTPSLGTWLGFNEVVFEQLAFNDIPKYVYETIYNEAPQHDREKMEGLYKLENDLYILRPKEEQAGIKGVGRFLNRIFAAYNRNHNDKEEPFTNLTIPAFYSNYRNWHNMAFNEIVKFRNDYAHGATPTEEECLEHIEQFLPRLKESLDLPWLHNTAVIVFNSDLQSLEIGAKWCNIKTLQIDETIEPFIPYLVLPDKKLLRLFPIVTYQSIPNEDKESISFFNDLKGIRHQEISYLNYPYAEHIRDDTVYKRFIEVFRLEEWRKTLLNEFEDLKLRLQESFKGRKAEIDYLQSFVEKNNRGFLYLYGIPGIGKSALVANAFNELNDKQTIIKYFVRNRKYTHVSQVLDYLNRTLDQLYHRQIQLSFGLGETEEEKRKLLDERLQHITPHLISEQEKLVLIIDGLDEGDQALLNNLIFETYVNVLVIYVARQTPEVTRFVNDLPLDYLTKKEIGKISSKDIRAMLYEVVNKYKLTEAYVQAIAKKSDGHPLYVRLLCDALAEYPEKLNDEHYLPEKWEEFYKRFIDRFIDDEHGQHILEALFVFAAAKDYLSQDQMRLILNKNAQQNLIIFNRLSELLIESLHERKHYQLFHETFHEYLIENHAFDVMDAEEKLLNYCLRWDRLERFGDSMMRYPLKHLATHLQDMNDLEKLKELVHHEMFINKQIEVTNQFTASFVLLESYRNVAYQNDNERAFIDSLIQIMRLNNKLRRNNRAEISDKTDISLTAWEHNLQNLQYYNDDEKGKTIFIHLWRSLSNDAAIIEQMLEEVNELLPKDQNLFNWSHYVPLPLLIELSIQLHERNIPISTIVDRVQVDQCELERTLANLSLQEKSVHVVHLFINQVQLTVYDSKLELLHVLIEKLLTSNLQHMVKFYEKSLLSQLQKLDYPFYFEDVRRQLALTYIEHGLINEAFEIVDDTSYGPLKQATYREIYESYKQSNSKVAIWAYTQGIEYLQQYRYDDRLKAIGEWLPIIYAEGPNEVYELFIQEIETALTQNIDSEMFIVLEHAVKHYWNINEFDKALGLIQKIADMGEVKYPLIISLHSLIVDESIKVPANIREQITRQYEGMKEALITNKLFNRRIYENELSYITKQWILNDRTSEAEALIERVTDVSTKEQLILNSLPIYLAINDRPSIVRSTLKLKEYEKTAIGWMIDQGLTEELIDYLSKVIPERNRENLYKYAAIEALRRGYYNLFEDLKKHLKTNRNTEVITFEKVFFYAIHDKFDEAVQLMINSNANKLVIGNIEDEITIALVQRLLNKGNAVGADEQLELVKRTISRSMMVEQAINYHLHRHQFTEAMELFDNELAYPSYSEEPYSYKVYSRATVNTLTAMIIKMSKAGDGRVVNLLESYFEKTSLYPDTLSPHFTAIKLLEQNGTYEYTEKIIDICENLIKAYSVESTGMMIALYPTVANQCDLANFYYNNGQKIKARHHLQEVIQNLSDNTHADQASLMLAYMRVAYECKRQGMTKEFNYFSEQYKRLYKSIYKDSVWGNMVRLYSQDGNVSKALDAIDKLSAYREERYVQLINELIVDGKLNEALEVLEVLTHKVDEKSKFHLLHAQKLLLHYYIDEKGIERALQMIQSVQDGESRYELYKEILQTITKEHLNIFLQYVIEEQSSLKHRLEKEIVTYSLTAPDFTMEQLRHIFAILSTGQSITAISLYVYKAFHNYFSDKKLDDLLLKQIDEVLDL